MIYIFIRGLGLVVLAGLLMGCAAVFQPPMSAAEIAVDDAARAAAAEAPRPPPKPRPKPSPEDPWVGSNRVAHSINSALDLIFLRPAARIAEAVTPRLFREGVSNVFRNLGEASSGVNKLLQGKGSGFGESALRLLINTTVGAAGFFDVASRLGVPYEYEDFGQTLAVWGVPAGPYIVLPFFGPSSVRGGFGQVGDMLMSPLNFLPLNLSLTEQTLLRGTDIVNLRVNLLALDFLISGDEYEFYRSSYMQRRKFLINDGELAEDPFGQDDF